jgi:hypothetical protein
MRYRYVMLAASLAACSSNVAEPVLPAGNDPFFGASISYQEVFGKFAGTINSVAPGDTLDGRLALQIVQGPGDSVLSGTTALSGSVMSVNGLTNFSANGSFIGTLDEGDHPSLHLTFASPGCPDHTARFAGPINGDGDVMILTGPLEVFLPGSCKVAFTFQSVIVLIK